MFIVSARSSAYTLNLGSFSKRKPEHPKRTPASGVPFVVVLFGLLRSPQRLIRLWNWKSALLSLILRGPIFLVATIRRGLEPAASALLTESVFCVLTAGFYGAVVQIMRDAEPEWLTAVFLTLAVPTVFQLLEYWLHWLRGTPHLRIAELVSIAVSAVSALFNWYAMRRGTLLVGAEGRDFASDLRRLPGLVVGFLAVLPQRYFKREGSDCPGAVRRLGNGECP